MIERINTLSLWIMRLWIVNILWIFFLVLGAGVFGLFPSTIAMFTILRKWIKGEVEIQLFRQFKISFRKNFWRSNLTASFFYVVGLILWIDVWNFSGGDSLLSLIAYCILLFICLLYLITFLYFFPVCVHYDVNPFVHVKYALMLAFAHPIRTTILVAGTAFLWLTFVKIPIFIFFFSFSLTGLWTMKWVYDMFPQK